MPVKLSQQYTTMRERKGPYGQQTRRFAVVFGLDNNSRVVYK